MPDWIDELTPEERSEWDDFVDHFRRESLEQITQSQAFISIVPHEDDVDPKFMMELGAAIMLGKPIIVVARSDCEVPAKLAELADYIFRGDIDTEEGSKQLAKALAGVMKEMD